MNYRNSELQSGFVDWLKHEIKGWPNPFFITLTFKDDVSKQFAEKSAKQFHNRLSRAVYKSAHRRYNKTVKIVCVIEGEAHPHIHAICDIEHNIETIVTNDGDFSKQIWNFGKSECQRYDTEKSGVEYLCKRRSKTGNYADNFVILNTEE